MPGRLASILILAATVGLIAPAAHAGESSSKPPDPNEKICETITPTGSRLGGRRICATRAEWDEKRQADRDAIDQGQRSPCVLTHSGSGGKPSC